jgi:radical SAM superfamily enzyme YgiQ (UPF0313 family)
MSEQNTIEYELGPIRPPSEAFSLLVRLTRNCSWNRCKFCHIYKGERFEIRPVEDIKLDIRTNRLVYDQILAMARQHGYENNLPDLAASIVNNADDHVSRNVGLFLYGGGETAFLQDGNNLIMPTADLAEVIRFLKETLPTITRITSYARSKTAYKKTVAEMKELYAAGLSRLHIGLESGYDPVLEFMDKGVTAAEHIQGGQNVVASGISLSEYVLLGLGGRKWSREHALETARVLNAINPDYIRIRTLTVNSYMPLYQEIQNGNFMQVTDEEIAEEERLLLENLECESHLVSDHSTNLFMEIEGKLPHDKAAMLEAIERFQALPAEERENFRIGRRGGIYDRLDDLNDPNKHEAASRMVDRLRGDETTVDEAKVRRIMQRFI